ncbi:MAG: c-type cytochrome [Bacteroidia bacterium]
MTGEDLVKRGEYLTITTGCDHCHTPKKMTPEGPVPDMERWLMGHPAGNPLPEIDKTEIEPGKWALLNSDLTAAVGPWGISFSANLTPHETGIGNWSFDQFKKAMKEGKHKGLDGGRPLMPPMPWQAYSHMNDDDLKAIFEYLKSIKPIDNLVPAYVPPDEIE